MEPFPTITGRLSCTGPEPQYQGPNGSHVVRDGTPPPPEIANYHLMEERAMTASNSASLAAAGTLARRVPPKHKYTAVSAPKILARKAKNRAKNKAARKARQKQR